MPRTWIGNWPLADDSDGENLAAKEVWDEATIEDRGKDLFSRAVQIWRR